MFIYLLFMYDILYKVNHGNKFILEKPGPCDAQHINAKTYFNAFQ